MGTACEYGCGVLDLPELCELVFGGYEDGLALFDRRLTFFFYRSRGATSLASLESSCRFSVTLLIVRSATRSGRTTTRAAFWLERESSHRVG